MMKKAKDVTGFKINCRDYKKCPICYGCRNYNPKYKKCLDLCSKKADRCNTTKHRSDLIAQLMSMNSVETKGEKI